MEKKNRLEFIDSAKGILILMCVISHSGVLVVDEKCHVWDFLYQLSRFWMSFFMPAFFIITGYCSRFDKDFKTFFISNFKSLMIPSFFLTCLVIGARCLFSLSFSFSDIKFIVSTIIKDGGLFWFLPAMFISKLIFYIVYNKCNYKCHLFLVTIILFLGLYFYKNGFHNYWSIQHAAVFAFFIFIGQRIKSITIPKHLWLLFFAECFVYTIYYIVCGDYTPRFTKGIDVSYIELPMLIVTSISGTLFILEISKLIESSVRSLKIFGIHSLVIYCLHVHVMEIIKSFGLYNHLNIELYYCVFLVFTALFCLAVSVLLNKDKVKILLGKF